MAGFHAAGFGASCEAVDAGSRGVIVAAGFSQSYKVPDLPIGMDAHEDALMVKGNTTPIEAGMFFSIEPMICIYGESGVLLEDFVVMTEDGPRWFTEPCHSADDPFGLSA